MGPDPKRTKIGSREETTTGRKYVGLNKITLIEKAQFRNP